MRILHSNFKALFKGILERYDKEKEITFPKEMQAREKKQFFDGLRWILVGKQVFPDIEIVYQIIYQKTKNKFF